MSKLWFSWESQLLGGLINQTYVKLKFFDTISTDISTMDVCAYNQIWTTLFFKTFAIFKVHLIYWKSFDVMYNCVYQDIRH